MGLDPTKRRSDYRQQHCIGRQHTAIWVSFNTGPGASGTPFPLSADVCQMSVEFVCVCVFLRNMGCSFHVGLTIMMQLEGLWG